MESDEAREAQYLYFDKIVSGHLLEQSVQANIFPHRYTYRIGLVSLHSGAIHRFLARLHRQFISDEEPCLWQYSLQSSDLDGLPCTLHFQEYQRMQTLQPHLWVEIEVNVSFERTEQAVMYVTEGEGHYVPWCGQGIIEGSLQHKLFYRLWEVMANRGLIGSITS